MSLWSDFLNNDKKMIHKWVQFFPVYERHFAAWKSKSLVFLEIGVSKGGSLQMWQRYFGPYAKIIGVDINPECQKHEESGIFVRIGDQSDPDFLKTIVEEFGVPDIILNDGSHVMKHIRSTFDFFYPKMHKNAIYMVEDLYTAYWEEFGGGFECAESFIEYAKKCVDKLNADHTRGALTADLITKQTCAIGFYDSIVCFEKGDIFRKEAPQIGSTSH